MLGWFVVFLRVDILQVSCAVLLVCGVVVVFVTMVFWVLLPSWWCGFGALRLWFGLWVGLAGLVLVCYFWVFVTVWAFRIWFGLGLIRMVWIWWLVGWFECCCAVGWYLIRFGCVGLLGLVSYGC